MRWPLSFTLSCAKNRTRQHVANALNVNVECTQSRFELTTFATEFYSALSNTVLHCIHNFGYIGRVTKSFPLHTSRHYYTRCRTCHPTAVVPTCIFGQLLAADTGLRMNALTLLVIMHMAVDPAARFLLPDPDGNTMLICVCDWKGPSWSGD